MISEDQQEQAALSALGLLDDDEQAEFERALTADPELRALVDELRESAAALALAAEPETLQPRRELKARLLAQVVGERPGAKQTRPGSRSFWNKELSWAFAAAAAGFALLTFLDRTRQQGELRRVQALAFNLQTETRQQALTIQQLNEARDRDALARQRTSPLTQVAVCRLELAPTVPEPPGGTVVWDPSRRQGELLITRLKPPAEGHDYQLWVVENGRKDAVSAGVVQVDAGGNAKVEFKPDDSGGKEAQAFAVSLEKAGGSRTNQGPIVLTGKF